MSVKLLTLLHLEFLSLKGGCTGLSESTHVKMPHRWKSHVTAHFISSLIHFVLLQDSRKHMAPTVGSTGRYIRRGFEERSR